VLSKNRNVKTNKSKILQKPKSLYTPIYIDRIMIKEERRDAQQKGWLHKSEIWLYDEITRRFHSAGYSWKRAQQKADIMMRVEREDKKLNDVVKTLIEKKRSI